MTGQVLVDVRTVLARPPIALARFARDNAACWR